MSQVEKWAILGAGRGLGRAFAQVAARHQPELNLHLSSRRPERLVSLAKELELNEPVEIASWDFSQESRHEEILTELKAFAPTRIFYVAGGGPHGAFERKEWKDHEWALKLNLIFPAKLLHASLKWLQMKQWIFVGSSIAENKADSFASSYAAGKHALLGLISSVRGEAERDIRLFSPGYLDTEMLPPNAKVRQQGHIWSPTEAAELLYTWSLKPISTSYHFTMAPFKNSIDTEVE